MPIGDLGKPNSPCEFRLDFSGLEGFMNQLRRMTLAGVSAMVLVCLPAATSEAAITLDFDSSSASSNVPSTGASASVVMTFVDEAGDVRINFVITNTTGTLPSFGAGATESMLTGIAVDLVQPGPPSSAVLSRLAVTSTPSSRMSISSRSRIRTQSASLIGDL